MDFLKDIFGSEALTYEQLHGKLQDKGIKIGNLSNGDYVSKFRYEEAERLRKEAEKKIPEDYDPQWKSKAEAIAEEKLTSYKNAQAIDKAIADAKVKDAVSVKANLDMDKISVDDKGEVKGLSEQLEALKTDKAFLFEADTKKSDPILNLGGSTNGTAPEGKTSSIKSAIEEYYSK